MYNQQSKALAAQTKQYVQILCKQERNCKGPSPCHILLSSPKLSATSQRPIITTLFIIITITNDMMLLVVVIIIPL